MESSPPDPSSSLPTAGSMDDDARANQMQRVRSRRMSRKQGVSWASIVGPMRMRSILRQKRLEKAKLSGSTDSRPERRGSAAGEHASSLAEDGFPNEESKQISRSQTASAGQMKGLLGQPAHAPQPSRIPSPPARPHAPSTAAANGGTWTTGGQAGAPQSPSMRTMLPPVRELSRIDTPEAMQPRTQWPQPPSRNGQGADLDTVKSDASVGAPVQQWSGMSRATDQGEHSAPQQAGLADGGSDGSEGSSEGGWRDASQDGARAGDEVPTRQQDAAAEDDFIEILAARLQQRKAERALGFCGLASIACACCVPCCGAACSSCQPAGASRGGVQPSNDTRRLADEALQAVRAAREQSVQRARATSIGLSGAHQQQKQQQVKGLRTGGHGPAVVPPGVPERYRSIQTLERAGGDPSSNREQGTTPGGGAGSGHLNTPRALLEHSKDDELFEVAVELMADADASRETDLVSPQHPFAKLFLADLWGHVMTLAAVGLMALAFFEHETHVPARSNPKFSWAVGSIEAALLVVLATDQYMRAVAELFVRPCSDPRRPWKSMARACGCASAGNEDRKPVASTGYVQLEEGLLASEFADAAQGRGKAQQPPASCARACSGFPQSFLMFQDKKWENAAFIVLIYCALDWVLYYLFFVRSSFRWSRILRPLLLIVRSPDLRRQLAAVSRTLQAMVPLAALFGVVVFFYATLGCQLFSSEQVDGYHKTGDNFDSFGAAAVAINILSSTESYPTVFYPAFAARPVVAVLFFVSSLWVFLWVIIPLLLAITFELYNDVQEKSRRRLRVKAYLPLVAAFKVAGYLVERRKHRQVGLSTTVPLPPSDLPRAVGEAEKSAQRGKPQFFSRMPVAPNAFQLRQHRLGGRSSSVGRRHIREEDSDSSADGHPMESGKRQRSAETHRRRSQQETRSSVPFERFTEPDQDPSEWQRLPGDWREAAFARECSQAGVLPVDDPVVRSVFEELLWRSHGMRPRAARALLAALDVEDGQGGEGMLSAVEFLAFPQFVGIAPQGMQAVPCWQVCGRRYQRQENNAGNEAGPGDPQQSLGMGVSAPQSPGRQPLHIDSSLLDMTKQQSVPLAVEQHSLQGTGRASADAVRTEHTRRNEQDGVGWCCMLGGSSGQVGHARLRAAARKVVWSPWFPYFALAISVGSAVTACGWTVQQQVDYEKCLASHGRWSQECRGKGVPMMDLAAVVFLLLQAIEVAVRVASTGGIVRWLANSGWHAFDFVVLVWSLTASVALFLGAKQHLSTLHVDWLEVSRALRVLRLVVVVPSLRGFIDNITGSRASSSVLRASVIFTVLYCSVTYSFGLVGLRLFGHVKGGLEPVTGDDDAGIDDDEGQGQVYTFRSLPYALLALFQIATSNNWNQILYPAVNQTSRWCSIYFILYYVGVTLILTSIVEGVIVSSYEYTAAESRRNELQLALFEAAGGEQDADDGDDGDGGAQGGTDPGTGPVRRKRKANPMSSFVAAREHVSPAGLPRLRDSVGRVPLPPVSMAAASLVAPCCFRAHDSGGSSWGGGIGGSGVGHGSRDRRRRMQPDWQFDELSGSSASCWECTSAAWLLCCPSGALCDIRRRVQSRPQLEQQQQHQQRSKSSRGGSRRASVVGVRELGVSASRLMEYVASLREEVREDVLHEIPKWMRPGGQGPAGEDEDDEDGDDFEEESDAMLGDLDGGSSNRGLNAAQAAVLLAELSELFEGTGEE